MQLILDCAATSSVQVVAVAADADVATLRRQAADAFGVKASRLVLAFDGEKLTDLKTELADTGAQDGSTFNVELQEVPEIPISRRERLRCILQHEVRSKQRWFEKVRDETITAKWCKEVQEAFDAADQGGVPFNREELFAEVLASLSAEAELIVAGQPKTSTAAPLCVRVRDDVFSAAEAAKLNAVLEPFRAAEDWHPGSNNQVLDLIHPSLFCYVSAKEASKRSRVTADRPATSYAWLPTDFAVEDTPQGPRVTPLGYINNVPEGSPATQVICEALGRLVPMLRTVSDPNKGPESSSEPHEVSEQDKLVVEEYKGLQKAAAKEQSEWVLNFNGEMMSDFHEKMEGLEYGSEAFMAKALECFPEIDADMIDEAVDEALETQGDGAEASCEDGEADGEDDEDEDEDASGEQSMEASGDGDDDDDGNDDDDDVPKTCMDDPFTLAFNGDLTNLKKSYFVNRETVDFRHKERGTTLLYTAARFGHLDVVKWLLKPARNAKVDQPNLDAGSKSTPLHGAAFGGHAGIAKLLLKKGGLQLLEAKNAHGDTPLDDAKSPAQGVKKKAKTETIAVLEGAKKQTEMKSASGKKTLVKLKAAVEKKKKDNAARRELFLRAALFTRESHLPEPVDLMEAILSARRAEQAMLKKETTQCIEIGNKMQVIVKAADIVLTPENPSYPGGTWHLEGAAENIAATAIFYYGQENITPSHLEFRGRVDDEDMEYEQCVHEHILLQYGVENEEPRNKYLGEVSTPAGRCIAFPNDKQHRAAPFQLVDQTKPGVRKMLVFFLIDPNAPVVSTSDIPRQQDFVSLAQARENREKLMESRRNFIIETNEDWEEQISLCEH